MISCSFFYLTVLVLKTMQAVFRKRQIFTLFVWNWRVEQRESKTSLDCPQVPIRVCDNLEAPCASHCPRLKKQQGVGMITYLLSIRDGLGIQLGLWKQLWHCYSRQLTIGTIDGQHTRFVHTSNNMCPFFYSSGKHHKEL